MAYFWLGLTVTLAFVQCTFGGFTIEDETRLRNDKLNSYNRAVRPSNPTNILLSFQLTAISGVDLKNQQFSVTGWWSMHWSDSRLEWNQSQYNNIPVIQIFEDRIWTPTVVVDNSVDDLSAVDEDTIPLRVDSRGTVNWNPPGLHTVNCEMDITHFPFDTQVCALQITSFGYTLQELDLYVYGDGINLNYYSGDGEWDMLSNWSERDTYTEGRYSYARVYYYFKLERKPLYYGLNMVLPVLVTAVLTVFVFLLPAESGEKIGYCLTVLLAFMVILTLIAGDLPTTASNTSLLELYIAVVLIMGALSVVLSIYVLEIYHRPDDILMSDFVRSLTLLGTRINCYDNSACCLRKRVEPEENLGETENRYKFYNGRNVYHDRSFNGNDTIATSDKVSRKETPPSQKPQLPRKHTALNLRPVTDQSTPEDVSRGGEITWKTVSIVMDGFLLRLYVLLLTVASAVFLTLLVTG
ncbi:neuronal acetylcholine receptor subunit alpha-3 [Plakobranchus ocellatus]|uniref:Neuronal acetylcholine receptor subunit alpha-3 n=1 Tax=Plakobranchus ocellatus TaxID=259542 RepID=A0AAV4CGK3_9GAST|nr:neuronal acetylcholine receptor subunit alpha-3 [Plakobranchus ocellatus]